MKIKQHKWFTLDHYTVCVGTVKDEAFPDGSVQTPDEIRAVRIHVSYANQALRLLKYVSLQWLLVDTEGYSYDSTIWRKLYGDDAPRKLQEGHLNPGRQARGWVAFKVPKRAEIAYVQFRPNYSAKAVADIVLDSVQQTDHSLKPSATATAVVTSIPLSNGQTYELKKPIIDFFGNEFVPQDRLTYRETYAPYHGLYILVFAEATLYLHEFKHAEILAKISTYFQSV